jgi:HrpA-like RNA helicase
MVLESKTQGVSREVLAIVAGLTIQDPRERPLERREQADAMHARFVDPTSDFLTLLNLWNHLEERQRELSGNAFRRMCRSEFLNYLTRGISGYLADRTGKYWPFIFVGYILNLAAVPALALAGNWQIAAGLILLQGIGRGMRKPIVEAMLSYTTGQLGTGWAYGVHDALDKAGRTLGPLVITLVLFLNGDYRTGYALLAVSTVLALIFLTVARIQFPAPSNLEQQHTARAKGFTAAYWLYMLAGICFAAGLMNFELIAFHLASTGVVGPWTSRARWWK